MPKFDFSKVPDVDDYSPLPEGDYICELVEIDDSREDDNDQWTLKFEIIEGDFKGRYIWDGMFFTEKAKPRCKLMCSRMGVDVSGTVDVTPELLIGRKVILELIQEEYIDKDEKKQTRNRTSFAGYKKFEGEIKSESRKSETEVDKEMPF